MNKLTFGLLALLISTSLGLASPLSSAASQQTPEPVVQQWKQPTVPAGTPSPADIQSPSLSDAASRFIRELSSKQGFEQWKQGSWTSYALGPGTRGWLILISANGREIGYLVLHAAGPDTYRLTEYGNGEFPLFSMQTLHQTMVRLELLEYSYQAERLYFNPLQALWKITVKDADREWYVDAKTGEELPFSDGGKLPVLKPTPQAETNAFTKTESSHIIKETGQTVPSEPNMRLPWVQGKPEAGVTAGKLKEWIDQARKPIYSAELYDGSVIVPLSVSGYQTWSGGTMFVKVLQDDDRYLPFESLSSVGGFYP